MTGARIIERIPQIVLIVSALVLSWLWMQVLHELGHVLHAWTSGGGVQAVMLHPLTISFTDVRPNPRPLFVAWGGVIWGCLLPLGLWAISRLTFAGYSWLLRFFAGFCLIANGVYLAAAIWQPAGDAKMLLELEMPMWVLVVVGTFMAATGLWCWNGLGHQFGWKRDHGEVDHRAAWAIATLLVATLAIELIASPR